MLFYCLEGKYVVSCLWVGSGYYITALCHGHMAAASAYILIMMDFSRLSYNCLHDTVSR